MINRCGILAGPWQMGKVDQGVITLWVARHYFGRPLRYIGYGGQGKQVRDLLHVDDLFDLLVLQLADPGGLGRPDLQHRRRKPGLRFAPRVDARPAPRQPGGGYPIEPRARDPAASICGSTFRIAARSSASSVGARARGVESIVRDIRDWIDAHHEKLAPILGRPN